MKNIFFKSTLLLLVLLFTGCSIDGVISNENGDKLQNVKVIATYAKQTQETYTDKNGHYILNNIDNTTEISISVSKSGYKSKTKVSSVRDKNTYLDFVLEFDMQGNPEISSLKGQIVDTHGNPVKGLVSIVNGNDYFARSDKDNLGRFNLIADATPNILFEPQDTVKVSFFFSELSRSKNSVQFERTYIVKDFLDPDDITTMDIGTISIEVGKVKGCAVDIDGSVFGKSIDSYEWRSIIGVSFDKRLDDYQPKRIYDKDKGQFEFDFFIDNKIHTLTLRDANGNTDTITFLADKATVDLTDSCIQPQLKIIKEIEVKVETSDANSISDIRFYPLSKHQNNPGEQLNDDNTFSVTKSTKYQIKFTDKEPIAKPVYPRDSSAYIDDTLEFTFTFNGKVRKLSTTENRLDSDNKINHYLIFGVYQGEIVFPYLNE